MHGRAVLAAAPSSAPVACLPATDTALPPWHGLLCIEAACTLTPRVRAASSAQVAALLSCTLQVGCLQGILNMALAAALALPGGEEAASHTPIVTAVKMV